MLTAQADFVAAVKARREEKLLVPLAVALLHEAGRLVRLVLRSAGKDKHIYIAAAPLKGKGGENPPRPRSIPTACARPTRRWCGAAVSLPWPSLRSRRRPAFRRRSL